jgi:hypothetical protein
MWTGMVWNSGPVWDPDAGVLGLHDVVVDLHARPGDGVAAGGRVGVAGVRPDRVGALGAATVGLVGAGVDDDEVVDDPVGLEQVAVAVGVALVLDVVVGPGEVGVAGRQGVDRVDHQLGHLAGVRRLGPPPPAPGRRGDRVRMPDGRPPGRIGSG